MKYVIKNRNNICVVLCYMGMLCFLLQAYSGGKGKPVEGTQKQPAGAAGEAGAYKVW